MYKELESADNKLVGTKQILRALSADDIAVVYIADDADKEIKEKILHAIGDSDIHIVYVDTKSELGRVCGIDVGTACAATRR